MKLKNLTNKLVTVCGIGILPGETKNVPDEEAASNSVVDFFLKTNRLTAVAEKSTTRKAKKSEKTEDPGKTDEPEKDTEPESGAAPGEGGQE